MKRQVLAGAVPPNWWERLKGAQFGFIAGLPVGLLMGWFFHGVISLAIRFGLLLVLLLPLLVIGWLWLRSQRAPRPTEGAPPGAMTARESGWTTVIDVPHASPPRREPEDSPLIDVPFTKPTRPAQSLPPDAPNNRNPLNTPDDIEAELDALKRQRERGA